MDVTKENSVEERDQGQHYELLRELGDCYRSVGDFAQALRC